jgi:hypothetical protein
VKFAPSKVLLIEKANRSNNVYSHKLGGKREKIDEDIIGRNYDYNDMAATKIQSAFRGYRSRRMNNLPTKVYRPYRKQRNSRYEWRFQDVTFPENNFQRLLDTFNISFYDYNDDLDYVWKNPSGSIVMVTNNDPELASATCVISCTSPELLSQFLYSFEQSVETII